MWSHQHSFITGSYSLTIQQAVAAVYITSSHILLSRGVARSSSAPPSPILSPVALPVVSIFETGAVHFMSLGSHSQTTGVTHTLFTPTNIPRDTVTGEVCRFSLDPSAEAGNILSQYFKIHTSHNRESAEISSSSVMAPRGAQSNALFVQESSHALFGPEARLPSPANSPSTSTSIGSKNKGKDITACSQMPGPNSPNMEPSLPSGRTTASSSSIDSIFEMQRHERSSVGIFDDPEARYEDEVLEPYHGQQVSCSVSEVLSRASTVDPTLPQDRSIRSISCSPASGNGNGVKSRQQRDKRDLPDSVLRRLLKYLIHEDYLALRLTCRCLSARVTSIKPLRLPAVYFLPVEILQQIFALLRPVDFNAARHTCRAWMMSSLNKSLLISMLKRAGWWSSTEADLASYSQRRGLVKAGVNEEWLLSKKLARECSLGPNWAGNGLGTSVLETPAGNSTRGFATNEHLTTPKTDAKHITGLSLTSTVDFSELGSASVGSPHGPGITFTVSICGKYLMVAEGCLVYVYSLQPSNDDTGPPSEYGGSLRGITSIVCPRRVLAVSMDSSSQRFAIAVLMDGRMGLVCDLHDTTNPQAHHASRTSSHMSGVVYGDMSYQLPGSCKLANIAFPTSPYTSDHAISEPAASGSDWFVNDQYDRHACMLNNTFRGSIDEANPLPSTSIPNHGVNIETGPRSIYRNLCSEEDPPRSVAICPQRRCVAYGCAAGIELHWVDALTSQDLNRWFPLTAPSDFLFFLPPRRGVDSAKKLRLISSAGRPEDKPVISLRYVSTDRVGDGFWSNMLFSASGVGGGSVGSAASDHYRAVPLSDGYHVVFTDPVSGCVCLGSDAPVGGPTKLVRRILFLGPREEGGVVWPGVYAVGGELGWGVRVVVAFGEAIWLFCVPVDVWRDAKLEVAGKEDGEVSSSDWKGFWKGDMENESGNGGENGLWPVRIRGQEIGRVEGGVVDLAVECGKGELRVWGFGRGGGVFVWEVDDGKRGREVRRRGVVTGGKVVDYDGESGEEGVKNGMEDSGGFDGASSSLEEAEVGEMREVDGDGDVLMEDEGYDSEGGDGDGGGEGDADGDVEMTDAPEVEDAEGTTHRLEESSIGEDVEWIEDLLRNGGGWEDEEGFFDGLGVGRVECDVL